MHTRRETTPRYPGCVLLAPHAAVRAGQVRTVPWISQKLTKKCKSWNCINFRSIQGALLCCCSLRSAKRSSVRSFGCPGHCPGIARGLCNRAATVPEHSWSIPSHFHTVFFLFFLVFCWFFSYFFLIFCWFFSCFFAGFFLYNSSIRNIHQKHTKLYGRRLGSASFLAESARQVW